MEKTKTKPVHVVSVGLIQAAIWPNIGNHGDFYSVTFDRLFKRDDETPWENSNSFRKKDIAAVLLTAEDAYKWIASNEANK